MKRTLRGWVTSWSTAHCKELTQIKPRCCDCDARRTRGLQAWWNILITTFSLLCLQTHPIRTHCQQKACGEYHESQFSLRGLLWESLQASLTSLYCVCSQFFQFALHTCPKLALQLSFTNKYCWYTAPGPFPYLLLCTPRHNAHSVRTVTHTLHLIESCKFETILKLGLHTGHVLYCICTVWYKAVIAI